MTEDRNGILRQIENIFLDKNIKRIFLYCLNDEKMLRLILKEISDKKIDDIIVFQNINKSLEEFIHD